MALESVETEREAQAGRCDPMACVSSGLRVLLLVLLVTKNGKQNTSAKQHLHNREFPDA